MMQAHHHRRRHHLYWINTLDTLTDGSEYTGVGTVFLSFWKASPLEHQRFANENTVNPSSAEESDSGDSSSSVANVALENDDDEGKESNNQNGDDPPTSPAVVSWLRDQWSMTTPLARYALTGVGDATARLCADQRFKLAPVKAVFLNSGGGSVEGLSALLLALVSVGAPSLHIVGDSGAWIEEIVQMVLGKKPTSLTVSICQVPSSSSTASTSTSPTWYQVYQDDYLIVHAMRRQNQAGGGIIYLHSFRNHHTSKTSETSKGHLSYYSTLAVFPPRTEHVSQQVKQLSQQPLPLLPVPPYTAMAVQEEKVTIELVLALNPSSCASKSETNGDYESVSLDEEDDEEDDDVSVLVTYPHERGTFHDEMDSATTTSLYRNRAMWDPGILIRSQQVFQCQQPLYPEAFVTATVSCVGELCTTHQHRTRYSFHGDRSQGVVLESATSVVLLPTADSFNGSRKIALVPWNRRFDLWSKDVHEHEWTSTLKPLKEFLSPLTPSPNLPDRHRQEKDEHELGIGDLESQNEENNDENEIDIDDTDAESDSVPETRDIKINSSSSVTSKPEERAAFGQGRRPQLLVLGTGCATPSAYRGASGYALSIPSTSKHGESGQFIRRDIFLLDCGEGTATTLCRHFHHGIEAAAALGHRSNTFARIRGIWISHGHLDHYGGLPTVVRAIHSARSAAKSNDSSQAATTAAPPEKRQRIDSNAVWIMAPPKVLQYLDLVLSSHHGRAKTPAGTMTTLFVPLLHHDPTIPAGPWISFRSFPVDHNCFPAFGLLVEFPDANEAPNGGAPVRFCFSGDTCPCRSLVQICQRSSLHRSATSSSASIRPHETRVSGRPPSLFLLHEATFSDADHHQARQRKHSTFSEALSVAKSIQASRVLLTHFSQRYISLPIPVDPNDKPTTAADDSRSSATRRHSSEESNSTIPWALATDGLVIDL